MFKENNNQEKIYVLINHLGLIMKDTITLICTKRIIVDLKSERERINTPRLYKKAERIVLLSIVDAFEQGNIKGAIDIAQDSKNQKLFEFPIWEYLDDVFYSIIHDIVNERGVWKKEKE